MIHHLSTSSPSPPGLDSTKISQVWTPLTRLSSQNRLPTSRADQGFYFLPFMQKFFLGTDWWNCDFTRIDPKFVNNPELSDIQVRPITNSGKIVFSSKYFQNTNNTIKIFSKYNTNTINLIPKPVQFRVEGRLFYAHKLVLITSSFKFRWTVMMQILVIDYFLWWYVDMTTTTKDQLSNGTREFTKYFQVDVELQVLRGFTASAADQRHQIRNFWNGSFCLVLKTALRFNRIIAIAIVFIFCIKIIIIIIENLPSFLHQVM